MKIIYGTLKAMRMTEVRKPLLKCSIKKTQAHFFPCVSIKEKGLLSEPDTKNLCLQSNIEMVTIVFCYLVPKGSPDLYKPTFLESVYESHLVMAQV